MADSIVTVRDVFELPLPGSPEESSARWQALRQWISEDLGNTKSSALEDVGATVEELLNIPVSDIFLKSWKETDPIKNLLSESRKAPETITNVELADHTIKSKHHPHIEVRKKKETSKRIEFALRLVFKLQGFSLQIQNGQIREMRTGPCEMQGTLEYQGLAVAEKKNAPIDLPEVVAFHQGQKTEVAKPAAASESKPPTPEAAPKLKPSELVPPTLERAVTPPAVDPVASPPRLESKKVSATADVSNLIPPKKITPKVDEPPPAPPVSQSPPEVIQEEVEEDREVFVL